MNCSIAFETKADLLQHLLKLGPRDFSELAAEGLSRPDVLCSIDELKSCGNEFVITEFDGVVRLGNVARN
jgi:hypothetical protein